MNRKLKGYGKVHKKIEDESVMRKKKRPLAEIEEVYAPRWKRDKLTNNRCCHTTPLTDDSDSPIESEYINAAKKRIPLVQSNVNQETPSGSRKCIENTECIPQKLALEIMGQNQIEITDRHANTSKLDNTEKRNKYTENSQDQTKTFDRNEIVTQYSAKTHGVKGTFKKVLPYANLETLPHQKKNNETKSNPARKGIVDKQLEVPFLYVDQQYDNVVFANKSVGEETQLRVEDIGNVCVCGRFKTENSSQYTKPMNHNDAVDMSLQKDKETLTEYHNAPKKLHICDTPNVKVVAVKFTKYKKNNIEVRRIEEKIVCVEYDVFENVDIKTPIQKMRAFFAIKPVDDENGETKLRDIPSTIKSKMRISTTDLQNISKKEIEIIDGSIVDNQPYLDDLKKILRRKQNYDEKVNKTLDVNVLYKMAKQNLLDMDDHLISKDITKEQLDEMKNLILKNTKSSVQGIRRTTVKNPKTSENTTAISKSLINEVMKSELELL